MRGAALSRALAIIAVMCALTARAASEPKGWRSLAPPGTVSTVGTAHPVRVLANAASGRWVVACESRGFAPDEAWRVPPKDLAIWRALEPYLIRGGGEGAAIDELVAVSADDRWLVVMRGGALILVDDNGERERTLVSTRVHVTRDGGHRVAAFTRDSAYLAYVRRADTIVIRTLATDQERTLKIRGEVIARILPEPVGHWARVLLRRTGKDDAERRYEPPYPPTGERRRAAPTDKRCDFRELYWSYGVQGAQRWLNLETGELRSDPDVQTRLGEVTIRRTRDGALWSGLDEVVPASCAIRVRAVSLAPLRIVGTCTATGEFAPLQIYGPRFHVTNAPVFRALSMNVVRFVEGAHVCVRPVGACVRTRDGSVVPVGSGEALADGAHVVVWDERGLFIPTGPAPNHRTPLTSHGADPRAGTFRAFGRVVVDLAAGRVLGVFDALPLALDARGRGLLAASGPDKDAWPVGPLRWVAPH